jgi:hypothetical protein
MGYKKVVVAGIALILAMDMTGKVTSYSRAEVKLPASVSISTSGDALISVNQVPSDELGAFLAENPSDELLAVLKVTNRMAHTIWIERINSDQKGFSVVPMEDDIALKIRETKSIPLSIKCHEAIQPGTKKDISVTIKVAWNGGEAEIVQSLSIQIPDKVKDADEVNDEKDVEDEANPKQSDVEKDSTEEQGTENQQEETVDDGEINEDGTEENAEKEDAVDEQSEAQQREKVKDSDREPDNIKSSDEQKQDEGYEDKRETDVSLENDKDS